MTKEKMIARMLIQLALYVSGDETYEETIEYMKKQIGDYDSEVEEVEE